MTFVCTRLNNTSIKFSHKEVDRDEIEDHSPMSGFLVLGLYLPRPMRDGVVEDNM